MQGHKIIERGKQLTQRKVEKTKLTGKEKPKGTSVSALNKTMPKIIAAYVLGTTIPQRSSIEF